MKKFEFEKAWSWWRRRRWWVRYFGYAAILITGFYTVENLRGWWAWRSYKATAEARGERFDVKAFAPSEIPEEENFAAAPLIRKMFQEGNQFIPPSCVPVRPPPAPGSMTLKSPFFGFNRGPDFLVSRQFPLECYFPAGSPDRDRAAVGLLKRLEPWGSLLCELKSAARRPHFESPFDLLEEPDHLYSNHWKWPLAGARLLRIRALAGLRTGDGPRAASDLIGALQVIRHRCEDPFGWGSFGDHGQLSYQEQVIWEGLKSKAWDAESLVQIGRALARVDFRKRFVDRAAAERAIMMESIDRARDHRWQELRRNDSPAWQLHSENYPPFPGMKGNPGWYNDLQNFLTIAVFCLAPDGWFDQNKVTYCRAAEIATNVQSQDLPPSGAALYPRSADPTPYSFLVNGFVNGAATFLNHHTAYEIPYAEALRRLALIAIALEKHRLARDAYPSTLSELQPDYMSAIPVDPYSGSSPVFRLEDGSPVIYSVGENRKDDGGEISTDRTRGDIVWRYSLPAGVSVEDFNSSQGGGPRIE